MKINKKRTVLYSALLVLFAISSALFFYYFILGTSKEMYFTMGYAVVCSVVLGGYLVLIAEGGEDEKQTGGERK